MRSDMARTRGMIITSSSRRQLDDRMRQSSKVFIKRFWRILSSVAARRTSGRSSLVERARAFAQSAILPVPLPNFVIGSTADVAYEAYVFCLLLRGARNMGGRRRSISVELRNLQTQTTSNGSSTTILVLRADGGPPYDPRFGYAEIGLSYTSVEIHAEFAVPSVLAFPGLEVPSVTHEVDVAITSPQSAGCQLITAIECKWHKNTPAIGYIRHQIGVLSEVDPHFACRTSPALAPHSWVWRAD
jgi:hypothetical protein